MIIAFAKPVKNVSPCGALVYAAMPALYPTIARFAMGKLEARKAVNELVVKLEECSMRSSGVEWRVHADAENNAPELTEGGWLVVDVYAKVNCFVDFYATRFRMRRKRADVVEVDVISLGNEPVGDA